MTAPADSPLGEAAVPAGSISGDYPAICGRVRGLIAGSVPPGATFAVVSKGDDDLVRVEGRKGWHFPRTATGQYAGHHPPSAQAAIDHLEEIRAAGAGYLVLPSIYAWWLDYYAELADHIESRYRVHAEDEGAGVVFGLQAEITVDEAPLESESGPLARQLSEFLGCLLADDGPFLLVLADGEDEIKVGQSATLREAPPDHGPAGGSATEAFFRELPAWADRVSYIVVARRPPDRRVGRRPLIEGLRRRYRLVARQDRLCVVFATGHEPKEGWGSE